MADKLPNDWFKRPGPHHAIEVSMDKVVALRAAIDPLCRYGMAEPLAALMNTSPEEVLEPGALNYLAHLCSDGEDFGLTDYGPLLDIAGVNLVFGEPLIPYIDPRVEPVSMFWADHEPYIPQHVAKASAIVDALGELDVPDSAWQRVLAEMTERTDDAPELAEIYAARDAEAPVLLAAWRREHAREVARFATEVTAIAKRDGFVMTWFSEQGWL